jgi:2-amino-4-hydroxy-6-hydroxymethyldihydropteridine diphosphokinase
MIILGLGSNMGERKDYLRRAIARLSACVSGIRLSHVFESSALLPADAPAEWNKPFLNMAISGQSSLSPDDLLAELKRVERDMGRQVRGFWGPREIDIDILAIDDVTLETPALNIPHHELLNRDFALLPLVDIAPDWKYPLEGTYKGWRAFDIAAAKGFKPCDALVDIGELGL